MYVGFLGIFTNPDIQAWQTATGISISTANNEDLLIGLEFFL